jgi:hypothetical protein
MKKSFLVLVTSALLITLFPGAAKAAPGDTTTFPVVCVSSGWTYLYLEYGINSVTVTNPSGCDVSQSFYFSDGTGSTWSYSETIGGTTTSRSFVPGAFFETGSIGSADSFTLTLASASSNYITISGGTLSLKVYFNKQIETLSPDPVAIGQQVTVTGSNLSSLTSLSFQDGSKYFSVTTANRTATQLTFTVPLTVTDWRGVTSDLTIGTYRLSASSTATSKTLTLTVAPAVVSVSAEEVARLAAVAATAQREADKSSARALILTKFKSNEKISLETFAQAEINGITAQNIDAVQAEIDALPKESRGDITQILKIARKYEIVGMIASDRVTSVYANNLIEIGLIPAGSKHKAALTAAIKKLPASERSSYEAIKAAIDAELADIQARNNRSKTILSRIVSHRTY